jgi:hypothetical protein
MYIKIVLIIVTINKDEAPKRLRNPPKKGFQQKTFDVKKANDHPEAKWPEDSSTIGWKCTDCVR